MALTPVRTLSPFRTPAMRGPPIDSSCVLCIRGEETGTTAYDSSSYGNNGTCYSGDTPTDLHTDAGRYGKALSFDGEDDYVNCGSDESFNYLSEITIELWAKNTNITTAGQNLVHAFPDVWILHYRGAGFYLKAEDDTVSGYLGWDYFTFGCLVASRCDMGR